MTLLNHVVEAPKVTRQNIMASMYIPHHSDFTCAKQLGGLMEYVTGMVLVNRAVYEVALRDLKDNEAILRRIKDERHEVKIIKRRARTLDQQRFFLRSKKHIDHLEVIGVDMRREYQTADDRYEWMRRFMAEIPAGKTEVLAVMMLLGRVHDLVTMEEYEEMEILLEHLFGR